MAKRGSIHLGLVSIVIAVVGAAGLAACSSDDDSGTGSGGSGGSSAGKGGAGGKAEGGSTTAGSSGSHAGAMNVAGTSPGGESAGGAGGDTAGAAGDTGNPSGGSPAGGGSNTGGAGNGGGGTTSLTPSTALKTHSPLPALPADTTNALADNAAAATLGQKLFFDKRYSGPLVALTPAGTVNPLGATGDTGKVACATCHSGPAMSDHRDPFNVTLGTNFHTRNAPALVNSSFYTWTNWAGRFSAQWELPLAVAENALTMNSNRLKLAHFIYDHYKADYEAVFSTTMNASLAASAADAARFPAEGKPKANSAAADGAWEDMTSDDQKVVNRIIVNFGKALQAYFRKLVSRDAPFDQYISANGGSAISESAKRGGELFVGKANCGACHSGPTFTDNKFHNLGVRQDNTVPHEPAVDNGRFSDAVALLGSSLNSSGAYSDDAVAGAARLAGLTSPMPADTTASFRTASLREVGDTAPYMHSGQLATLADVVKFYVAGGGTPAAGSTKDPALVPLTLSDAEQADLVEFLKTLSGAAVPAALLVDTSGQ
jgi:cytochrome c peroxidase